MVIVILGILAATALPKFVDLSKDARFATVRGAEGSIRSAANIAHAAFLIKASEVVAVEGTNYTLVNGYPAFGDIAALAGIGSGYASSVAGSTITISPEGATAANCKIEYTNAASNSSPTILLTATASGC
jgi:MSHA pilin protein MshA